MLRIFWNRLPGLEVELFLRVWTVGSVGMGCGIVLRYGTFAASSYWDVSYPSSVPPSVTGESFRVRKPRTGVDQESRMTGS